MLKVALNIFLFLAISLQLYAQEGIEIDQTYIDFVQENIKRLTRHQSDHYDKGEYDKFKLYTDTILHIARKNNLKDIEIDAVIRQGVFYKKLAEYDKALAHYLEALELSKNISERYKKQTVILINTGNIYNEIYDSDKAEEAFNEALKYIEDHSGPDIYRMACYIGLGDAVFLKGDYEKSIDYNEKAKQIGEKLNRDDIIIASLNNMANNYLSLKKYNTSLECSEKALDLYDEKQSMDRRARSLLLKGSALIKLKRYDESILPLQIAQGIAFTHEYRKIQMNTHEKLANVFEKKGDFQKANMQRKGYIQYKELYLKTLSKTQRIVVEKKLAENEKILKKQNKDLSILSAEKKFYVIGGFICILILSIILFFYVKKNKLTKQEALLLKKDRMLLKNENEALKIKIYKQAQEISSSSISKDNPTYKKSSLTQEDREHHLKKILDYMEAEKPFLDMDIKQSDIAQNLSMSVHHFSEVLNVCLKKNFNNFINLYRINEAKKLMKKTEYENYKIIAIAYEAGFNSKTSFNRVFKQLVGQTPSEYRQQYI